MSFIMGLIKDEMRLHPHFALLLVMLSAGILGYSYRVFAQQEYVDAEIINLNSARSSEVKIIESKLAEVNTRISGLQSITDKRYYQQTMTQVGSEIFQLERLESGDEATVRDLKRLKDLRAKEVIVQKSIDRINSGVYGNAY